MARGPLTITGVHTTIFGLNAVHEIAPIHVEVIEAIPEVKVTLRTPHTDLYPYEKAPFCIFVKNIGSESITSMHLEIEDWTGLTLLTDLEKFGVIGESIEVKIDFEFSAQIFPQKIEIGIICNSENPRYSVKNTVSLYFTIQQGLLVKSRSIKPHFL